MNRKKVGLWLRVSSIGQVETESLLHHEIRAKEFAEQRDYEVVKIYRLEAMSGGSVMKYPQTQEMLHDIKNGLISGLVFSKIARLARNTKELIDIADIFQEYHADLISMDMSIDTSTSIGRHFYRTMSSMAEWEREMISERVSSSVKTRAQLGKYLGGKPPLGYTYGKDKKLKIDEHEAQVRSKIFELFLEHRRKKTVAKKMNELGYRTKSGNLFSDSTVRRILTDPISKGVLIVNKSRSTKNGGERDKPVDEWVFQEVTPIVSEETWDEVNRIIEQQKKSHKQVLNTKVHLFTGFVFCDCGAQMNTRTNVASYACKKRCGNTIRKDDLEGIFKSELQDYTVKPENVDVFFDKLDHKLKTKELELPLLKQQKEKLERHLEKILWLHTEGQIKTESFKEHYRGPSEQLNQINENITAIEKELTSSVNLKRDTYLIIEKAQSLYERWDSLNHDDKRSIIELITKRITVSPESIDITLYSILPNDQAGDPSFKLPTNGQHMI